MLTIDISQIDTLLKTLKLIPKELEKVSSRAINKSLTTTRKHMVDTVRGEYAIKAKTVRSSLDLKKASWGKLRGRVRGTGGLGIPLLSYVPGKKSFPSTKRLKSGAYRPLGGVPVTILKAKGRMVAGGVFLARMKSGHTGAFKRKQTALRIKGSKSKIKEVFGPSPRLILSGGKYNEQIETFAGVTLQKNLIHETDFALRKIGLL